ncbi:alpha-1,2-mannosidase [Thecamonas trahens ATCC 50062]|uniref:Alpha-1,2-mannosidase n=1 Tax=Thecamonas trahens ATCC 50062 TaxID=461836 RepID=A0A0L0D9U9_THETB|nr:alpha-1,2-mannosidase [Thecamonas trahens ATCC 50062]KNC48866.1 alpha-1,2-mannosidase [Thecamonas trahens ATCC 50062]|eukprot:XP_013758286.1 alpha-1,2-mannosidase [Thecamonas trahens ATCC 50062]
MHLLSLALTLALALALVLTTAVATPDSTLSSPAPGPLGRHVDPFIGTGGTGFGIGSTPPGAQAPFGLVRASPDTTGLIYEIFNHFGGYYYHDDVDGKIRAFSHLHMQGAGAPDLGVIGVMLARKPPHQSCTTKFDGCWASRFSHSRESAFPGYYAVELESCKANVELTARPTAAFHRYTLDDHETYLYLAASHVVKDKSCANASVVVASPDGTSGAVALSGHIHVMGSLSERFGGVYAHFSGLLTAPPGCVIEVGTWGTNGEPAAGPGTTAGPGAGGWIKLAGASACAGKLELALGISIISAEQAAANLAHEQATASDFDAALAASIADWEAVLGNAAVVDDGGAVPELATKYYTALYHAHSAPTNYLEAGRVYLGFDSKVHRLDDAHNAYASDGSLWDVFRSQMGLLSILQPAYLGDFVHSLDLMRAQGGYVPRWPLANGYTGCMIGTHADLIVAEAWAKGIRNYNLTSLYAAFRASAMESQREAGRSDVADYVRLGYVCSDKSSRSVSRTLAYAADDWAIANMAVALGKTDDAAYFAARAQAAPRKLWNSGRGIMCGRTCAGAWGTLFTEGNAWQWSYFVPQNTTALAELMGGPAAFLHAVGKFLDRSFDDPSTFLPNPFYWAGNEPDLLVPWQPALVPGGRALTERITRKLLDKVYTTEPGGIPGNDDYGELSSWAAFASWGFYPLGGSDEYILGSPVFAKVFLAPLNCTVVRHAASPADYAVERVVLNGMPHTPPTINHAQLRNAVIEFFLAPARH